MTKIRLTAARLLTSAVSIALLALAPTVRADALQDISKQIKQGQHAQALEQIDKYLAGKPKDAQGRFLKGIVLTEMNKPNEAIEIFSKLTEDFPELPEPYNNLAVIYAQQKQFDKAKQALEMAIRTHPSYATAHENLGDIYARLASQAYDRALQIDSSNSSAQNKLALIRDLMSSGARAGKTSKPGTPVADAKPTAPTKPAETKPATPVVAAAAPVAQVQAPTPAQTPAAAAAAVEPAKPAKPAEAAKTSPTASSGDAKADVTKAIEQWATAWSRKDMKNYLAAYAPDFKTPGGEDRAAWEGERGRRINKPGDIQVTYENLHITVDGDSATAKFRQHYRSASLKTSSNKVLVLGKRNGKWQIVQERVGS